MPHMFISYRRADSSGYLIALYPRLEERFGRDSIFRDLDTIDYGVDFVQTIQDAVQSCDVLLAVIGPHWLTITDSEGSRRLDKPNDFVRLEVSTALQHNIRVIPVLVGGATMPNVDDLPEDLKPLARRNALEIHDMDFEVHVKRLITALERILEDRSPTPVFILPMMEWISIPGGHVEIEDHGTFEVPEFSIAKYPVTVGQYEYFVDDGGYSYRKHWTDTGWMWRQRENITLPEYWNHTYWHIENHPIVGVSWYEAFAFSQWLSMKLGYAVTLPTEIQWQRAAQGDDGRKFPWGNKFDGNRANTGASGIGKTTSVDQYPEGASPYGVMDMSGNVREWCLNGIKSLSTIDLGGSEKLAVRGGAWAVTDVNPARTDVRYAAYPGDRGSGRGFRLCRP